MNFPILLPNIFNHPFTYESDLKLEIGDFVEVPFGKSKIVGIVWKEFEQNNGKSFKIKKIIRKLETPKLKKKTLEFLNFTVSVLRLFILLAFTFADVPPPLKYLTVKVVSAGATP